MMDDMDRAFGDFGSSREEGMSTWVPPIEVSQRDGKYVVHAELPGIKPEDVKVELTDGALVVQGERKHEHEENQGGVRRSERSYGQFYRSIPVPEEIDPEQVNAKFENGVLEITIPLPQQQQNRNRQIPIQASSLQQSGPGAKPAASTGSASSSESTAKNPSQAA
jgi:HSP20 family protein